MTFTETVQTELVGHLGYTSADVDGVWGPKSERTFRAVILQEQNAIYGVRIPSPEGWEHIQAFVQQNDIFIRNARVTCFGGTKDKMDGGVTASGFDTRANYDFYGCSLPLRRDTLHDRRHGYVLRNSPIPAKLPWNTTVIFKEKKTGHALETKLVEIGPANWTGNTGDLMIKAAQFFDPKATANSFDMRADITIIGGAKYVGA